MRGSPHSSCLPPVGGPRLGGRAAYQLEPRLIALGNSLCVRGHRRALHPEERRQHPQYRLHRDGDRRHRHTDRTVAAVWRGDAGRYRPVTDRPILKVFVSNQHPDYFLGSQAFADVPIAALPGTIDGIRAEGRAVTENMYRLIGDWMRGTDMVVPIEPVWPATQVYGGHRLAADPAVRPHTGGPCDLRRNHAGAVRRRAGVFGPDADHAARRHSQMAQRRWTNWRRWMWRCWSPTTAPSGLTSPPSRRPATT